VALIAPCVVTLAACAASSSPLSVVVSSAGLRLAGIHWVLTRVSHNAKPSLVIPASTDANIEFHRDGTAVANDGVNGLDADFTATATAITLRNTNTQLEEQLAGQPQKTQDEIIRINTDARHAALQVALLIPILAGLAGLVVSFRMVRLPDPKQSGSDEQVVLG
jgi:hypothetical protein